MLEDKRQAGERRKELVQRLKLANTLSNALPGDAGRSQPQEDPDCLSSFEPNHPEHPVGEEANREVALASLSIDRLAALLAIHMNTGADLDQPTAIAPAPRTKAAAAPRLKLSPRGFAIDHPDPELGEQLMADALGVGDRDAMYGILRQLVRASVNGQKPDAVTLAFMISMVESIKPRDSLEAMLAAQMVSVHVMAMRCAHRLANADDIARQDSAARALGRLARTFSTQIEALNRYRNHGAPAITVQNVSVGDGGKAIVGNVTQHAGVIVSVDAKPEAQA